MGESLEELREQYKYDGPQIDDDWEEPPVEEMLDQHIDLLNDAGEELQSNFLLFEKIANHLGWDKSNIRRLSEEEQMAGDHGNAEYGIALMEFIEETVGTKKAS